MKERRNILLLIGMIISVFPLFIHIINLVSYASEMKLSQNILLLLGGNVALYMFVIFLAFLQLVRNHRNNSTWVLSVVGIILSVCSLVVLIIAIPSKLPHIQLLTSLELLSIADIIKRLLVDFGLVGMIGHILLLTGYIVSIPRRK